MNLKRYLFISNSNKPTEEKKVSRELVKLGNVRRPCIEAAYKLGYEIWLGVNEKDPEELEVESDIPIHLYDSHTYRNLLAFKDNFIAYKNLMNVLKKGRFEVIHCNTPIGGIMGRFCGKRAKVPHIIYTAHGFHFYKGAPLFNRTVLKWAEQIMAHWTDAIITMNQEDFEAAKKFRLRNNGKVYYVPGVGIDTATYFSLTVDKCQIRKKMGFSNQDFICISMGDLIKRKNYKVAIEAIAKCNNKFIHYLICGKGPEEETLKKEAERLKVSDQIHFLGYRTDVKELLKISDVFLFTSLQEGLPRSLMEAMASGLPCIASNIRGNTDLIENGKGGYLISPKDMNAIAEGILELQSNPELRQEMINWNLKKIKSFDQKIVERRILEIYKDILIKNNA